MIFCSTSLKHSLSLIRTSQSEHEDWNLMTLTHQADNLQPVSGATIMLDSNAEIGGMLSDCSGPSCTRLSRFIIVYPELGSAGCNTVHPHHSYLCYRWKFAHHHWNAHTRNDQGCLYKQIRPNSIPGSVVALSSMKCRGKCEASTRVAPSSLAC